MKLGQTMRIIKSASLLIAGLTFSLLSLSPANAVDAPLRKSGLWEIKTESTNVGQTMLGPMTMQMCVDQSKDDLTADPRNKENLRKHCSKMEQKRMGNRIVIDSVCAFVRYTATSHSVITGNLETDYRLESTTNFNPPMQGVVQTMSSVSTGKWLGPCKPGQKPGTVTYSGMPGMPPGEYRVDPETMKRMQQYGR
jgi:hypothetical protein